jgi:site-specific recombinase XerD
VISLYGKKSIKDAGRSVKALVRYFGGRKAKSIEPRDISSYKAIRQDDGLTNGSINREVAALKPMFNIALENWNIIRKPHIEMLTENNVRQGFF